MKILLLIAALALIGCKSQEPPEPEVKIDQRALTVIDDAPPLVYGEVEYPDEEVE